MQVLAAAGNYSSSTSYTILSATGGISGTFAGVTSNLACLTPLLTYNANNVNLLLTRNSTSFASVGVTPNQIAAGGGVESIGAGNGVCSISRRRKPDMPSISSPARFLPRSRAC